MESSSFWSCFDVAPDFYRRLFLKQARLFKKFHAGSEQESWYQQRRGLNWGEVMDENRDGEWLSWETADPIPKPGEKT